MSRKWLPASKGTGPTADAVIDHPAPEGAWIEQEDVPLWIAPDPGGILPRAASVEFLVEAPQTPVQHSPQWAWNAGSPYPGPPSRVWGDYHTLDEDSRRWWGRTGAGQLIWSENTEFSADLPPNIPQDIVQHLDSWTYYLGGYPSIARNRPSAFSDQVPVLQPATFDLPEG